MKKYIFLGLSVLLFSGIVLPVHALTELQKNSIIEILRSFNVSEVTIVQVRSALEGAAPTQAPPTPVDARLSLSRTLHLGIQGDDVRALQEFLRKTGDYTHPSITGFYGSATQEAVQRYQSRMGIVSSGTANTTGFGVVGPSTRARIAQGATTRAIVAEMVSPSEVIDEPLTPSLLPETTPTPALTPTPTENPTPKPPVSVGNLPKISLTASSSFIKPGNSVTISWNTSYADHCTGFGERLFAQGSRTVSPSVSTTYSITCTNAHTGSATAQVSVQVDELSGLPVEPMQEVVIDGRNIYSAEPVVIGNVTYVYFGGWMSSPQRNDAIYRATCDAQGRNCGAPEIVLSAADTGFEHFNDPSIVQRTDPTTGRDYLIMYVTGVEAGQSGFVVTNNRIYYSTSWADNGRRWSTPRLLIENHWLPSAVVNSAGEIELYANDNAVHGGVVRFSLGSSGVVPSAPTRITLDTTDHYANVYVDYRAKEGRYVMLAERMVPESVIDSFVSNDGIKWARVRSGIVSAAEGQYRVGTPAFHPNNPHLIYFGSTAEKNSTAFKIRSVVVTPNPFSK